MNLATAVLMITAMAAAPNAFAVPVFYTDRAAFEAAAGSGLQSESFETVGQVQTIDSGFSLIFFPDSNNPEFVFASDEQAPGTQLTAANSGSLGLTNAITDGSGALTYTLNGFGNLFGFNVSDTGIPELSALNNSITAFGIDITTSVATSGSALSVDTSSTSASNAFTTNADTPQFVGFVDPEGITSVGYTNTVESAYNVAFDRLSYRVVSVSPASTSEYTLYIYTLVFIFNMTLLIS